MRDFRDAKAMAQTLRDALKTKSVSLTHGESLELIARAFGLHDWNVLAARIRARQPEHKRPAPSVAAGTVMPVVPLRDIVVFPQMIAPLFVGRDKTRRAVAKARAKAAASSPSGSGGQSMTIRLSRSTIPSASSATVIDSVTLKDIR